MSAGFQRWVSALGFSAGFQRGISALGFSAGFQRGISTWCGVLPAKGRRRGGDRSCDGPATGGGANPRFMALVHGLGSWPWFMTLVHDLSARPPLLLALAWSMPKVAAAAVLRIIEFPKIQTCRDIQ